LEGAGYSVGAVDTCAAGFGAPHIRQRLYFMADSERGASERHGQPVGGEARGDQGIGEVRAGTQRVRVDVGDGELDNAHSGRRQYGSEERCGDGEVRTSGEAERLCSEGSTVGPCNGFWSDAAWIPCRDGKWRAVEPGDESLVDGFAGELGLVRLVSYPDRPHEERIIYSPLIQKGKARVMRLRGYGNAIVAPRAIAFVEAYMEVVG